MTELLRNSGLTVAVLLCIIRDWHLQQYVSLLIGLYQNNVSLLNDKAIVVDNATLPKAQSK